MANKEKLYTLTEVSRRAGVSMPTLQRYKKLYQHRIPSVGVGRTQRYPKQAIAEIRKIKTENLKKRGRPRKSDSSTGSGAAVASNLITLTEIGKRTGISYPTLVRYVKLYLDKIPHEGEGRKRRFPVEAVAVFAELRKNSKRGRPKASESSKFAGSANRMDATLNQRIRDLERAQREVSKQLASVLALLKKPVQVTIRPQ